MYEELRNDIIKAIAEYYGIDADVNSYDWNAGCTICGNDGEYNWLTLRNVLKAIDGVIEDIAYNLDD